MSGILRCLLGLLFLWASASKLANPLEFLASIYAYQVPFPEPLMKLVAIGLPWAELMCGLLLLANLWADSALVAATGLLVVFLLFTGQAWIRGLNISCGCFNLSIFGISETNPNLVKFVESVGFAFFRNIVLASICFFLLRSRWVDLKAAASLQQAAASLQQPALKRSKGLAVAQREPTRLR